MNESTYRPRILVIALAIAGLLAAHAVIKAADHADSPDTSEGNLDVNDLYVFNQGDNVVFAMTVSPPARARCVHLGRRLQPERSVPVQARS